MNRFAATFGFTKPILLCGTLCVGIVAVCCGQQPSPPGATSATIDIPALPPYASLGAAAAPKIIVAGGRILQGPTSLKLEGEGIYLGAHQITRPAAQGTRDSVPVTSPELRTRYLRVPFIARRVSSGLPLSRAVNAYYREVDLHLQRTGRSYRLAVDSVGQAAALVRANALVLSDSLGIGHDAAPMFTNCGGGSITLPTIGRYAFDCGSAVPGENTKPTPLDRYEAEIAYIREQLRSPVPVVIIYSKTGRSTYSGKTLGRDVAEQVLRAAGRGGQSQDGVVPRPSGISVVLDAQLEEIRTINASGGVR